MTLIDTSVWIEFLRASGSPAIKQRVSHLFDLGEAAYTCPIAYELMIGARDHELKDLETALELAKRIHFEPEYWGTAWSIDRRLRKRGVSVQRDDILVATVASLHECPLLCRDRHFELIRTNGGITIDVIQLA